MFCTDGLHAGPPSKTRIRAAPRHPNICRASLVSRGFTRSVVGVDGYDLNEKPWHEDSRQKL